MKRRTLVSVGDPIGLPRRREPLYFTVEAELAAPLWRAIGRDGRELLCQRLSEGSGPGRTALVTTVDLEGDFEFELIEPIEDTTVAAGIATKEPAELDAHVRLDTGYFDLELCRGTGQGTGASKWGLRHFSAQFEGIDLLPSGNNAIGGFYGPFFTPENGLINPPEHVVADVEELEIGPVLHRYRLSGTIPDGLLPELHGKRFAVEWTFTYGTPYFVRKYFVDEFQTIINGRFVDKKITVGDEFESGIGDVTFNRFAAYDGTRYREGDPYAVQLAVMVDDTLKSEAVRSHKFNDFKKNLVGTMGELHWDLYWRLFSVWERALDEAEIRERLATIRHASHGLADAASREWVLTAPTTAVNVAARSEQTIFAGPASKTVEFDAERSRAMVWWTSKPSGAFQIVQRPESGWVNWGTNGENECPELPVGVEIKTAYGSFVDSWQATADGLETPPTVSVTI